MPRKRLDTLLEHLRRWTGTRPGGELADSTLLERFANQRDEAAFAALVERHGPMVFGVCRRVLGQHEDAEDAFQATFLILARRAAAVRRRESLAAWLHMVASRLALRARAEAARLPTEARDLTMLPAEPDSSTIWRDLRPVLDEELQRLPAKYRAPVVLCYLEGYTHAEAAQQLGWPTGTVAGRLARARALLRGRLERRGLTLSAAGLATLLAEQTLAAPLPAGLARLAIGSAVAFATVGTTAGLSAKVVALAEGGLQAMLMTKVKLGAVLLALVLAATGAGMWAQQVLSAKPAEQGPPADLPRTADQPKPDEKAEQVRTDRYGDPLPVGTLARLGTARFRHGNGSSLAFAPSGKTILTFGADRTIRHWDVSTGYQFREQRLPEAPHTPGWGVLSPDGQLLAFQEDLETFVLWDVSRNRLRRRLPLGERWWHDAAFAPDSKTLVTAQHSGILKAWDVVTGQSRLLGRHKRELNTLSFAADGTLVTVCMARELRCWDLATAQEKYQMTLPEHVRGATISPDGRTLALLSWGNPELDKGVQFWDSTTRKPAAGWATPDVRRVHAAHFAPDGKTVLIASEQKILVWDSAAGKALHTFSAGSEQKIAFSPDGKTVAALGRGRPDHPQGAVLFVWNLTTGASHAANAQERGHFFEVDSVAITPDGRTIATACREDCTVRLWEAATGRLLRTLPVTALTYRGLSFSPEGKHLFTGTATSIILWDVETGQEVRRYMRYEAGKAEPHWLGPLQLTDDGRMLLAVSQNADRKGSQWTLLAWDVATGRRQRSIPLPGDYWMSYGRFSTDGRLVALSDGSVHDATSGKELLRLSIAGKKLTMPVALSPDGALAAIAVLQITKVPDGQRAEILGVQVWELATLLPVVWLETGEVAHSLFTPDGCGLITAGRDALTRWDLVSGRAVVRRVAHAQMRGSFGPSFVSCLALAPDGRTVATGHADTTVLLWDLPAPATKQPTAPLLAKEQEVRWADLAGADAGRAMAALARLADVPGQTTQLLAERLRPALAPPAEELRRLLADLDAPQFERREKATNRLWELHDTVDAALREALKGQPPAEARRRIEELLAEPRLVRSPEVRRHLRAVRLLEFLGSAEARRLLERLAAGVPEARLTREAKAAVQRLAQRARQAAP